MFKRLVGLFFALSIAWPLAFARAQEPLPAGVHEQIIWVPDYYGQKIYRYVVDQTTNPATFSSTTINLNKKASTQNCNPNSVAVKLGNLYIVCNSDFGGLDEILVLNASTYAYVTTISGTGPSGDGHGPYNYFSGASLIGIAFDSHKNLWVSGINSNSLYRVPLSQLTSSSPKVDRQIIHSPDSPTGLTFDSSGNLWVAGFYADGILLEFTDATINFAGTYLQGDPYNPMPSLCLSNDQEAGCTSVSGLFNNPEGVASFDGAIWVANNGGNAPAATLVRVVPKTGGFKTSLYGSAPNTPFSCPGGLFAPVLAGATPQLWVNDEGYGFQNGDCGASAASQGSGVGLVHAFTAADLMNHQTAPTPEVFPGHAKLFTGSPGFGGIFVQLN